MSDNRYVEEDIPANEILPSQSGQLNIRQIVASEHNFYEISMEDDADDNIEYVGYSDDDEHNVLIEEVHEEVEDTDQTESCNAKIKDEFDSPIDADTNALYHCSSCNTRFNFVNEHINRFHRNQSILLDDDSEKRQETEQYSVQEYPDGLPIKAEPIEEENEEFENMEMTEVEYILEEVDNVNENENDKNHSEELFNDAQGRPYMRKKVKITDQNLINPSSHSCDSCRATFMTLNDFYKHECSGVNSVKRARLPFQRRRVKQDQMTIVSLSSNELETLYGCTECLKKFPNERLFKFHMRVDHKFQNKTTNVKKAAATPVVCSICNTTFPSNKSYRLHSRMHDPIKMKPIEEAIGYEMKSCSKDGKISTETFFCEICNKSYDLSFEEDHRKSHTNGLKHICTVCNKKFANEINLKMHLEAHQDHAKIKTPTKAEMNGIVLPYECGYCGRQFARPHEKVKHERIHTGEKPYKCEICGKCFRVSYCLMLHLRTHTAARPYVCPHCNKRFKAYSVYNHHLMTHSDERPYKCPHCPKAFKTSVQLAGHKNSHTKPFSCPECNRPFASLYAVKAHMETHKRGGQNLKHRCIVCGAIYARVFALKDHMREQHQTSFVDGNEVTDINLSEVPFIHENEISTHSILPDNVEEITIGEIEHFQTEEIVTDWLK